LIFNCGPRSMPKWGNQHDSSSSWEKERKEKCFHPLALFDCANNPLDFDQIYPTPFCLHVTIIYIMYFHTSQYYPYPLSPQITFCKKVTLTVVASAIFNMLHARKYKQVAGQFVSLLSNLSTFSIFF